MPEYLKAEMAGRKGSCETYQKKCSKSIFKWEEKIDGYESNAQNEI